MFSALAMDQKAKPQSVTKLSLITKFSKGTALISEEFHKIVTTIAVL